MEAPKFNITNGSILLCSNSPLIWYIYIFGVHLPVISQIQLILAKCYLHHLSIIIYSRLTRNGGNILLPESLERISHKKYYKGL